MSQSCSKGGGGGGERIAFFRQQNVKLGKAEWPIAFKLELPIKTEKKTEKDSISERAVTDEESNLRGH